MQDGAYPPRNYATLGPLRIQPPLTIVLCEYDPQLLMYAVYYIFYLYSVIMLSYHNGLQLPGTASYNCIHGYPVD